MKGSDMSRVTAEFIAHRVAALAFVSLTRRPDVVVTKIGEPGELDLLARVRPPQGRQMRYFGVIAKGTVRHLDDADASRELRTYFRQAERGRDPTEYPFPVVALIFSMEDDEEYFEWRTRPSVADGVPTLETVSAFQCRRFTKAQLDEVIDAVNHWYESLFDSFQLLHS